MTRILAVPLADYERVRERLDLSEARTDAAVKSLRALVRQLERVQGYSTYEAQAELREARALLAEAG